MLFVPGGKVDFFINSVICRLLDWVRGCNIKLNGDDILLQGFSPVGSATSFGDEMPNVRTRRGSDRA